MTGKYTTKLFRTTLLAIFVSVTPLTYAQAQQTDSSREISHLIHILVGAYNGAVSAAKQNGGTSAEPVTQDDMQSVEKMLQRYQGDLQGMVKSDGEVDTIRLGRFLNRLQTEHNGVLDYDFVHALRALQGLSPGDDPEAFLNSKVLNEVVQSAKNPTLKGNLSQAVPYVATALQFGDLIQQDKHLNQAALNQEIQGLQRIVRHYQATSDLPQAVRELTAELKIFYADKQLGKKIDSKQQQTLQAQSAQLRQRLRKTDPGQISTVDYDNLLQLLAVLGKPFAQEYGAWQILKNASTHTTANSNHKNLDSATKKLLDDLHYDQLPAGIQRELRKRLNLPLL